MSNFIYQYLVGGRGRDKVHVLTEDRTKEEIEYGTVLQDSADHTFRFFKTPQEMWSWYKDGRDYHEAIFERQPQKVKIDFDAQVGEVPSEAKLIPVLLNALVAALSNIYEEFTFDVSDIAVASSCGTSNMTGADRTKVSYHLLLMNYSVFSCDESRMITEEMIRILPHSLAKYIDEGVNKRVQFFRMVGAVKTGSMRSKVFCPRIASAYGTALPRREDTLIVDYTAMPLPQQAFYERVEHERTALSARMETALATPEVRAITNHHTMRECRGKYIQFDRMSPSNCDICLRTHENDNTLTIEVSNSGGVYQRCRKAKNKSLFVVSINNSHVESEVTELVLASAERAAVANIPADIGYRVCDPLLQHIYNQDHMKTFELVPTLCVRAQMKLGKTKALINLINEHFNSGGIVEPIIRLISFRQTFSSDAKERMPGMELYSEHTGTLDHIKFPRLIIQAESLWRVSITPGQEPIDLLVLDECESILEQFDSGLHQHFGASFAVFEWMLMTAKHVVCMDANIAQRTFNTLARSRPAHPSFLHWNTFSRAAEDKYYIYDSPDQWQHDLMTDLSTGKSIVVPMNSLTEAKALRLQLEQKFPFKRIELYSSETVPSIKSRDFANVHNVWTYIDVLIYTPTVSAGISYELEHFDVLYAFMIDDSCPIETCRQMLGRVRNISSHEHRIYLKGNRRNYPTDVEDIRKVINDQRSNLFRTMDSNNLTMKYEANGAITYHESNYFWLWLENTRMRNLSKNNFTERMVQQVIDSGASVEYVKNERTPLCEVIARERLDARKEIKYVENLDIAGAQHITVEKMLTIQRDQRDNVDVSLADRNSLTKFRLLRSYNMNGVDILPEFVKIYNVSNVKQMYNNLIRIVSGKTVGKSLRKIQEDEAGIYEGVMTDREYCVDSNNTIEFGDMHYNYTYHKHQCALILMRICGFNCILDKECVHGNRLVTELRTRESQIRNIVGRFDFNSDVSYIIGFPKVSPINNDVYLIKMLKYINQVLNLMYGICVTKLKYKDESSDIPHYALDRTKMKKLFKFVTSGDPIDTTKPTIVVNLKPLGDPDVSALVLDTYSD